MVYCISHTRACSWKRGIINSEVYAFIFINVVIKNKNGELVCSLLIDAGVYFVQPDSVLIMFVNIFPSEFLPQSTDVIPLRGKRSYQLLQKYSEATRVY